MSRAYPIGVIEDVLVGVKEFIFLIDFYVLDMEAESLSSRASIILGRPFLMIVKTVINVHAGTLTMELGEQVVQFSIFDTVRKPIKGHLVMQIAASTSPIQDSLCDIYFEFPELANFEGFASLSCNDCHDNFICLMCSKIDICLNGNTSIFIDCDAGADDVVSLELMDSYTKLAARSSTLLDDLCIEFLELVNFVGSVGCSFLH